VTISTSARLSIQSAHAFDHEERRIRANTVQSCINAISMCFVDFPAKDKRKKGKGKGKS